MFEDVELFIFLIVLVLRRDRYPCTFRNSISCELTNPIIAINPNHCKSCFNFVKNYLHDLMNQFINSTFCLQKRVTPSAVIGSAYFLQNNFLAETTRIVCFVFRCVFT